MGGVTAFWVLVVALLLGYPLLMRVLLDRVQSSRLEMTDLVSSLLADGRLDRGQGAAVRRSLDGAFSPLSAAACLLAFPGDVVSLMSGRRAFLWIPGSPPFALEAPLSRLCRLHALSMAAANPLLALPVLAIERSFRLPSAPPAGG
jgi:hypothetical protein